MDTKKLLIDLSGKIGVAGTEDEVAGYAASLLSKYGETEISPLGSVICRVKQPEDGGAHLLLDAHMDEIGMIVTFICDNGFIRIGACGGMDIRLLAASAVLIHAKGGALTGVVCSTPPHLSSGTDKKNKKVDEIYIDTGFSKEDAEKLIAPGDRVTLASAPRELLGGLVCGKALDDRAGCAVLLKTLEYMEGKDIPPNLGLSVVFSSMEEVGGMGAKTAAQSLMPTHALAVDVSYAHTPDSPREKCGLLGKGPMIGFSPILSHSVSQKLVKLAEENGIPFQREAMGGRTGTNIDGITTAGRGVVSALVSVPEKYMHTPNEVVSVEDVENSAKLIAAYIASFGETEGK